MWIKPIIKRVINGTPTVYSPIYTISDSSILKGKNIVITGGSSGIGKAIAIAASKRGANILIIGRKEAELKRVVGVIGEKAKYLVLDLNDTLDNNLFFSIEEMMKDNISALVNNAGVYVDNNYLHYSEADIDKIFSINTKSPFLLTQSYVNYCIKNDISGNIVFTTSNRSLMGDFGPYGMSKAAINNLIEGMARENIKNHIRINGVAPGMTASNINGIDPTGNLFTDSQKGQRVLLVEEIAEVVCFLLSDISNCITGAIIPCDDGDRLR